MKIAVIEGGLSSEAEVSRRSAAQLKEALVASKHEVKLFELDAVLAENLRNWGPDVVFPIAHGNLGEDGCLQGLLEILRIPYVGSDVAASAVAADKSLTKRLLRGAMIPIAKERLLLTKEVAELTEVGAEALLAQLRESLAEDLIVKPNVGGSTIGMTRVFSANAPEGETSARQFREALSLASRYADSILVEAYFRGIELTCAVLEDEQGRRALAPTLISAKSNDWYDFSAKYQSGGSEHLCPAPLAKEQLLQIQEMAVAAHQAVGARDLSRSDFLLNQAGEFICLEVNTLPGMTSTSLFPEAAAESGISFVQLVDGLARRAQARGLRVLSGGEPLG